MNADGFMSGVQSAQTAFGGLGDKISAGTVALGTALGNMATKAAGAVVDFGKESINTGMSFESAMSQIAATLGYTVDDIAGNINNAGDNFDALKKKAAEMGRETNFTASQSAEGLNILAMSGFDAQQSISMIGDVLHLAAAGSMDMASAAGYISGSMKGFADETKNSAYYADLMAKGATLANTSVSQLGEAMSSGAAGAAAYSQSAESMTVALLRLAEQGVVGSAAGTALAAAMKDIYTPTDQAKKALNELGVAAYENGKALDFNDVINDLSAALAGFSEEEANAYKQTIFGIQGLNAYNKMTVTGVEAQNNWAAALAGASEGMGEAAKQYDTMTSNLQGSKDMLSSALEGFQNAVYEHLAGPLTEATNLATSALSELTAGFEEGGLRGAIESLGQFAADTFKGIWDNLKLPPELEQVGTFFTGLADSLKPFAELVQSSVSEGFSAIAAGAKGLVDAFADADYGKIDGVASAAKRFLDAVGGAVIDKIESVVSLIPAFFDAFKNADVAETMGEIAQNAQGFFSSFLTASAKVIAEVAAGVAAFTEGFKDGGGADALAKVANGAEELFNSFLIASDTTISAIGTSVRNFLKGFDDYDVGVAASEFAKAAADLFDAVATTSGAALKDVADGVDALVNAGGGKVQSAGRGASDLAVAFSNLGASITSGFAAVIRDVGDAFSGMGAKLGEIVGRFGPDVGRLASAIADFSGMATDFGTKIRDIFSEVGHWINVVLVQALQAAVSMVIGLVGAIIDAITPIAEFFNATLHFAIDLFKGDWQSAWDDAKAAGKAFADFIEGLGDIIVRPFAAIVPQMKEIGANIIQGLWDGLKGMWDSVSGWFENTVGGLVNGVKGLLGIGSPSKVFAEIGKFTVQGMEVGWRSEFGVLESQVGRDVRRLTDTARIGFEDSAIGRSSAAGISSMFAANEGGGRGDPVSINLVLDGDVAATALYDPLRRTAFQRGQNMEAAYA